MLLELNREANPHRSSALETTNMSGSLEADIPTDQTFSVTHILVKCCAQRKPRTVCENFGEKENKRERARCPEAALITSGEPIVGKPCLQAA